MRTWLMALVLTGSLMLLSCSGTVSGVASEADVIAVLEKQQEAWNRGDLDGFLEGYEKSPEITFVGRTVSRGFDGLRQRYQNTYGSAEKMGKLTFSELEFRPLAPDAAFVIGRFSLARTEAGGGASTGRFTVILQKTPAGWKMVHDHTSAD